MKPAEEINVTSLTVTVPRLRPNTAGTAEVRPKRIEAWLEQLPRANPQDTGRQIYKALFNQNRLALEDSNRLEVTEVFRLPVASVVEVLQERYENSPIPHSEGTRDTCRFVSMLLTEMAYGYKAVAVNMALRGKRRDGTLDMSVAIQRAIYNLGQLLLNSYISYLPPPMSCWRDLHRLYQFAETYGLAEVPVVHPGVGLPEDRTSIEDTYKHLLLLAAADPYSLQHGEAKRLYDILTSVNGSARISARVEPEDPIGRFLITFTSDSPPIALAKETDPGSGDHLRVLNALDAIRDMHSLLKVSEQEIEKTGQDSGTVGLIRRVGRMWAGNPTRRQNMRSMNQHDLAVCAGIAATHWYSSAEPEGSEEDSDVDSGASPESGEPVEMYLDLTAVPDAEGLLYPGVSTPAADPEADAAADGDAADIKTVNHQLQLCHTIDESAGGVRLRVYLGSRVRVLVGDIVGMHIVSSNLWRAGVVRWVRAYEEGFVDIGVMYLAPYAQPVSIRPTSRATGDADGFVEALQLPANEQLNSPESVILPRGVYGPGDRLEIKDRAGSTSSVVPMHLIERTGTYDRIVVAPPPQSGDQNSGSSA